MALLTKEDWQVLKDYIHDRYTSEFSFSLDEYDNMNLVIVNEEHDPAKIAVLFSFIGEKAVFGDDILEQLYYELEQGDQ